MEMNQRNILITLASIFAIFGFLYVVYSMSSQPESTTTTQPVVAEAKTLKSSDHTTWSPAKKVILTEYADLQCPACRNFNDVLKSFKSDPAMKDVVAKITLVYRHYPLQQVHKNALAAAFYAEAASRQTNFFDMSELIYSTQTDWENSGDPTKQWDALAKDLKLDVKKLTADRNSKEVQDAVANDVASGNRVGVDSTPTFFLNGRQMQITSIEDFKSQLRAAAK